VIAALARPPIARLLRGPRAWLGVAAWGALAFAFAVAARERGSAHGADHVLIDTYGALALPLLSYVIVGAALASQSLRASTAALVAFGAQPVHAAAAAVAVAAASCAVVGALVAAAVAALAHGSADPPRWLDAAASAYVGALGGAAYAGWFALGASFGRRGGGRVLLLVLDWVLGATGGAGALATPRGHVRNLLGGAAPMDLSQRASAAALLLLAITWAAVAIRRARP
jgi:succinate dehydrogenase hydrophobic anchor subunit